MANLSPWLEQLAETNLVAIGSRMTQSRRAILAILERATAPLTASEIADLEAEVAQSSLYRNLSVLEEANLVHRIVGDSEFAHFELAEEVLGHHHHMRCTICGKVVDVELDDKTESQLDRLSKSVANKNQFDSAHHHLEFIGICADCAR